MTPKKPEEYIITNKKTGKIIHEGADRRSTLPNQGDFKTQIVLVIAGVILTGCLTLLGWAGDTAYRGITSSIADLKSSQEAGINKIWATISIRKANRDNQIMYILTQCGLTCKGEPPLVTAQ